MNYDDFKKNIDELQNLLNFNNTDKSSTYSFSKKKIIQDDTPTSRSKNETKSASFWNRVLNKFKKFKNTVVVCFSFNKKKVTNKYKKINWAEAGHKTANVLLKSWKIITPLIKIFPIVLLLFSITEIGLFISKNILPYTSNYNWGWNNAFIAKLPEIFRPTKQWFSQSLVIIFSFVYSLSALQANFSTKKQRIYFYNFIFSILVTIALCFPKFIYDINTYVFTSLVLPITLNVLILGELSEAFNSDSEYPEIGFLNDNCDICNIIALLISCILIGYCIYTPIDNIDYYLIGFLFATIPILTFIKKRFYIKPINVCPKCHENDAIFDEGEIAKELIDTKRNSDIYETWDVHTYKLTYRKSCEYCDWFCDEFKTSTENEHISYTELGYKREENRRHEQAMLKIERERQQAIREEQEECERRKREDREEYERRREERKKDEKEAFDYRMAREREEYERRMRGY